MTQWIPALQKSDIPLREGRVIYYGEKQIAVFNLGEKFCAVDNQCPHKQGPLAAGIVCGESVTCPLHNLNICLNSGKASNGGEGVVATYATKIEGDTVFVQVDDTQ